MGPYYVVVAWLSLSGIKTSSMMIHARLSLDTGAHKQSSLYTMIVLKCNKLNRNNSKSIIHRMILITTSERS